MTTPESPSPEPSDNPFHHLDDPLDQYGIHVDQLGQSTSYPGEPENDYPSADLTDDISNEHRTRLQRAAGTTYNAAIRILPSTVTVLKSVAVKHGSDRMDTWSGLITVGGARMGDVLDGALARKLNATSEIGEVLDHGLDKGEIGYMLKKAWELELVPEPVIAYIAGHNALNGVITLAAFADGVKVKAKKPNKYGMFGECTAIGVYAGAELAERGGHETAASRLRMFGHALMVPTVILGLKGTHGLIRQWQEGREVRREGQADLQDGAAGFQLETES
jgi:phosphatidylglycerophosphate synthase